MIKYKKNRPRQACFEFGSVRLQPIFFTIGHRSLHYTPVVHKLLSNDGTFRMIFAGHSR